MSIPHICVSSFLCFGCVAAVFFIQPHGNLTKQDTAPQTQEQIEARAALNQGVQAFKNGQYEEAIQQFSHAKQMDPELLNARLYLAVTYGSQYVPGVPSEENRQTGEAGIAEFKGVLNIQPDNLSAVDGIGSLLFQMAGQPFDAGKFRESKAFRQKHIQIKPDDPEPYYWIGVIDWSLAYRANGELREKFNEYAGGRKLSNVEPLPRDLREQYEREYGSTIDEGIASLKRAIELKPDYDDAMAYLNLLYRRKADTVASKAERDELTKMADELVDTLKEIKQKRAERQPQ
jgi:tetratricopeptide (TPR) repeat protein